MNRRKTGVGIEDVEVEGASRRRARARHFQRAGELRLGILYAALQAGSYGALVFFGIQFVLFRQEIDGLISIAAVLCVVGVGLVRMLHGNRVTCPLCHGQVLARRRCRMHRNAKRYWPLSYRASALIDMTVRGIFHCPFCGTLFRLKK